MYSAAVVAVRPVDVDCVFLSKTVFSISDLDVKCGRRASSTSESAATSDNTKRQSLSDPSAIDRFQIAVHEGGMAPTAYSYDPFMEERQPRRRAPAAAGSSTSSVTATSRGKMAYTDKSTRDPYLLQGDAIVERFRQQLQHISQAVKKREHPQLDSDNTKEEGPSHCHEEHPGHSAPGEDDVSRGKFLIIPIDSRHMIASYAHHSTAAASHEAAAAAASSSTVMRMSEGADTAAPEKAVLMARLDLGSSSSSSSDEVDAKGVAEKVQFVEGLPFRCISGFVRDYSLYNSAYNSSVAQHAWDEHVAAYGTAANDVTVSEPSPVGSVVGEGEEVSFSSHDGNDSNNNDDAVDNEACAADQEPADNTRRSSENVSRSPSPLAVSYDTNDAAASCDAGARASSARAAPSNQRPSSTHVAWEDEEALEKKYSTLWSHRFLVSDVESHAIWAVRASVAPGDMSLTVVPPAEFYKEVVSSSSPQQFCDGNKKNNNTAENRQRSTSSRRSASADAAEQLPMPLLGGSRGFMDGHFSIARFSSPTAMCWRLDEDGDPTAAAASGSSNNGLHPYSAGCEVLYISDTGNHAIRYANFRHRLVRTIAGLNGTPGYRDGSCVSSALREATALAWCSSGLLFTDGPNCVLRLISGIGRSATSAATTPMKKKRPIPTSADDSKKAELTTCENDSHDSGEDLQEKLLEASAMENAGGDAPSSELPNQEKDSSHHSEHAAAESAPSSTGGVPRVWTIAGAPPYTEKCTAASYSDATSPQQAQLGYLSDLSIVPDGLGSAQVVFADYTHHAIRTLDASGVRTLVGPLDYCSDSAGDGDAMDLPLGLASPVQVIPCALVKERSPLLVSAANTEIVSPQPYLHSASRMLFVVSAANAAVSMILPVSESSMECLAAATERRGSSGDLWERAVSDAMRVGVATTEGRRTLGEPGLLSVQQLVIPLDGSGDCEAASIEAREAAAESYLRMRFPWVLAPPLPRTESAITQWYCYVSGGRRRKGRSTASSATATGRNGLFAASPSGGAVPTVAPEPARGGDAEDDTMVGGGGSSPQPSRAVKRPHLLLPPSKSRSRSPVATQQQQQQSSPSTYLSQFDALSQTRKQQKLQVITALINGEKSPHDDDDCGAGAMSNKENMGSHVFVEVQDCDTNNGTQHRGSGTKARSRTPPPLTPRSISAHRLVKQKPHRLRSNSGSPRTDANNTKDADGGCTVPAIEEKKGDNRQVRMGDDISGVSAQQPDDSPLYDEAIAQLFSVYKFFAQKQTIHHARPVSATAMVVSQPQQTTSNNRRRRGSAAEKGAMTAIADYPIAAMESETRYSMSMMSLWRFLYHCGYADLPVAMAYASLSDPDCADAACWSDSVAFEGQPSTSMSASEDGTWLPFSLLDGRSLVEVLHQCGKHTRGYHVLASMDYKHFRRLILLLHTWEDHIKDFISEQLTLSAVSCTPRRLSEKLKDRTDTTWSLLDTLPSLDSLTTQQVMTAYRAAYQRAVNRVPGFRKHVRRPTDDPVTPTRSLTLAMSHNTEPSLDMTKTPQPQQPVPSMNFKRMDSAVLQPASGGSPPQLRSSAFSTPQLSPIGTPARMAEPSNDVTPRRFKQYHENHYTSADAAVDELLELLVRNEAAMQQLFSAYCVRTRVYRSSHYAPPQAAAAAVIASAASSFAEDASARDGDVVRENQGVHTVALRRDGKYQRRGTASGNRMAAQLTPKPLSRGAAAKQPALSSGTDATSWANNQDFSWKVRQLYTDSARINASLCNSRSELLPVVSFQAFQSLFKTLDVYPTLVSNSFLQRAFVDALQRPLFSPGCRRRDDVAEGTDAFWRASLHARAGLMDGVLRDKGGLLFGAFVEAFVRVALTAFSLVEEDDKTFPTAAAKVNALLVWVNRQVTLGLVAGREKSKGLRDGTIRFPAKFALFRVTERKSAHQ